MPKLTRAIGLPHATAIVVGIIIGASVFVQASEITAKVPSLAGVTLAWVVAGAADDGGRPGVRRVVVGLSADRRRLRVPARNVFAGRRIPVGLGDVLEHAH